MHRKMKENKKGFTLAELLIVVAIIAVLVAISIPLSLRNQGMQCQYRILELLMLKLKLHG